MLQDTTTLDVSVSLNIPNTVLAFFVGANFRIFLGSCALSCVSAYFLFAYLPSNSCDSAYNPTKYPNKCCPNFNIFVPVISKPSCHSLSKRIFTTLGKRSTKFELYLSVEMICAAFTCSILELKMGRHIKRNTKRKKTVIVRTV